MRPCHNGVNCCPDGLANIGAWSLINSASTMANHDSSDQIGTSVILIIELKAYLFGEIFSYQNRFRKLGALASQLINRVRLDSSTN